MSQTTTSTCFATVRTRGRSNTAAAEFLEKGYDGQAAYVVLAHLSESNNMPELARVAAEFALRNRMSLLANKLLLAEQHVPTESICL